MTAPNQMTLFLLLALIGGALIAGQGAINGRMAMTLGHPVQAAIISFAVGLLALVILSLVMGAGLPSLNLALKAPWWAWIGGLMGAYLVSTAAMAVPKIGVAVWVSGVIAGQLTAALVFDHFGAFGMAQKQIDLTRLGGVACLAIGVYLIRR